MKTILLVVHVFLLVISLGSYAEQTAEPQIFTNVLSEQDTQKDSFEWGQLLTYYAGETEYSKDALSGVAIINPGMQIHPPHVHSEEEYLMVLEGSGTWSVEGEEFSAQAGDLLYAAPWDEHGIKNTGSTPLRFVFFKWNPKPVEAVEKPAE